MSIDSLDAAVRSLMYRPSYREPAAKDGWHRLHTWGFQQNGVA